MGLFQYCCGYPIFGQNYELWIKNILMNKKRDEYVYLKSHVFSYIDDYLFNFFFSFVNYE
jgi:hypothetical protein